MKPSTVVLEDLSVIMMPITNAGPGIYFLCLGEDIIYIGKSVHPMTRVEGHLQNNQIKFDRCFLLPCEVSQLKEFETAFINWLRPKFNKMILKCPNLSRAIDKIFQISKPSKKFAAVENELLKNMQSKVEPNIREIAAWAARRG